MIPAHPGATAALLFVAVTALYLPSARNGFVYDDHEVILAQEPLRSARDLARVFAEPHGLPQSRLPYYRPTTRATLLLQKSWTGDAPAPFHAANALLMGAVAVAAHALLRRPGLGLSPAAAAWAAAAFALHPVASECTYPAASGRETALPALFFLAALAAWIGGGARGRAIAVLAYAGAIWSKESALVVPALAAWADVLRLPPDPPGRRAGVWLRRYAPFAIVTAAYLAARAAVLPGWSHGARDPALLFSALAAHPLGPLASLVYFAQSVFAPSARLAYEPTWESWLVPLRAAAGVAALAAAAGVALFAAPAERPAPRRAAAVFWLGWIPVAMALHLNLFPVEAPFAERYVFLSSLGALALAAIAARRLAARVGAPHMATATGVAVLAILALLTLQRGAAYRDEIAFANAWIESSPRQGNAHATLGAALARVDRFEEAVPALRRAVELDPRLASAHYNLGAALARLGRTDEAIAAFRDALAQWPADPDARYALGVLLARRGDDAGAALELRRALALRPGWPEAEAALRRVTPAPTR